MDVDQGLQTLTRFLKEIKGKHVSDVLEDLLTPKEITELAERIRILQMLEQGKPQREIANDLHISVTTVSRGSRVLQYGTKKIKKYL
ncbi:MAG: Trp family transcriptional regulator [bacterium]|nr:Trp family transcriptional regulator [bacterium]